MKRRDWIKQIGLSGAAWLGSSASRADTNDRLQNALLDIAGSQDVAFDDRIALNAPADAANGAVVPVGVVSALPNTTKIVLLVNNHARVKVAELDTSHPKIAARLATHLQLTEPAEITALVQSESRWYRNSTFIKTLGETCEP